MSLPSLAPELERAGNVLWLSRTQPILAGPSFGEMGLFERGWHDDFLGDLLMDEYEQRTVGALSSLVLQNAHGGVLRLTAGNVIANYARIMLGDSAYSTNNLDPDNGFRLIGRFRLSSTTSILGDMFVNAPVVQHIHITADTDQGPNWYLRTYDDSGGADIFTDSGVAFDTAMHWHVLEVSTGYAAHWMDGSLINSTTTKIPTIPMTANVRCLARANASKYMDLDYFAAVPE